MKTGEPGLHARAVFPSEGAFRALQQLHRGRARRLATRSRAAGSDYSAALGINNLGQVMDSANTATGTRAFRSRLTTGIVALDTLPGDT